MTVPDERMKAVRWGLDLLRALQNDCTLPQSFRSGASVLMDMYPSASGLEEALQSEAGLLPHPWAEALHQAALLFLDLEVAGHGNADVRGQLRYTRRHSPEVGTIKAMESVPLGFWLAVETRTRVDCERHET